MKLYLSPAELICQAFNPLDAQYILNILFNQLGSRDRFIWHWDSKGTFSVRDAYRIVLANFKSSHNNPEFSSYPDNLSRMWRISLQVKSKVKNFLWRCWHSYLGTKVDLASRGMLLDPKCDICGEADEDFGSYFISLSKGCQLLEICRSPVECTS
ncbi:ribonuclease H-like superfamily protein [Striga asiatica]|uniref:Ribonuclease H-like superfamily protein n=1 Tax=Striga asiatica TaxID=4170 RepID=A0A5A7RJR5_STRAF|nr:ribonuclease H-like superfamily protein [Striga asiatica]